MAAGLLRRLGGAVPGLGGGGLSHKPRVGPQRFEIACRICGGPVAGTRGERERFEPCGACGTPAFVLPADVYPRPPADPEPKSEPKKARTARPAPATASPPATGAAPRDRRPLRDRAADGAGAARAALKKRATPVRLAALATAVVVALTVWWGVRRAGVGAARQALVDAPPAAAAALAEGAFADAADRYAELAAALDTLGRGESDRAERARQRVREATAAANLASQTPFEIARQAAAATSPRARTAWGELFDSLHRGRWVILDAPAAAVPPVDVRGVTGDDAEPPPPRTELLYPLSVDGVTVRLVGDPAVPAGLTPADPPRRAILAAKYGACVRVADPAGGPGIWELRLEPGSAFLWATPETLAAVGFDLDGPDGAATRAVLAEQAAELGLAASEEPGNAADPAGEEE